MSTGPLDTSDPVLYPPLSAATPGASGEAPKTEPPSPKQAPPSQPPAAVASGAPPEWASALFARFDALALDVQELKRTQVAGVDVGDQEQFPPHLRDTNPFPQRPNRTSSKPQLLNLHGDEVYDALKKENRSGVVQEYRTLASALSYLFDAKEFFLLEILSLDVADTETAQDLQRLHNGLDGVYTLLNNRYAFVSARTLAGSNDPELVAFLQSKVYGSLGGLEVTSNAISGWISEFETAKANAALREGAKRSAGSSSGSTTASSRKRKGALPGKKKTREGDPE